jgi:tetratricopeptide (TPR) repeat protein
MHRYGREILIGVILFAVTVLAFGRACGNGFISLDDPHYVNMNRQVQTGLSLENLSWAFTTFHAGNWHPLTWLSLQLDSQLFGIGAWGYHLSNVLLHALSAVLLFWALRLMTGMSWQSGIVAGLFALHPLHVESVAWIAERKDVVSGFFWMLTCLAYGWYAARPNWMRYLLTLLAFAVGLLGKPMLVTLPCALLLLDYWPLRRFAAQKSGQQPFGQPNNKRTATSAQLRAGKDHLLLRWGLLVVEKLPFFVLTAAACVVTWYAQRFGQAIRSFDDYSFVTRLGNSLLAYCQYLGQLLWPANLGPFYSHPADSTSQGGLSLVQWPVVGAAILLIVITVAVCAKGRSFPYLPVGWFWYLGTLVPVIGLVQVGNAGRADRYTYVPLVGIFIAVVWAAGELAARWRVQRIALGLAGVILFMCAAQTSIQVGYWHDSIALWEHSLEACGESGLAHLNLGSALLEEARRLEGAESKACFKAAEHHLRKSVSLDGATQAMHSLGVVLEMQGRVEEAFQLYSEVVRRAPNWARAHHSLAAVLTSRGQKERAKEEYIEALRCDPGWAPSNHDLGLLLLNEGKVDQAIEHFQAAVRTGLTTASGYYSLGYALVRGEDFDHAVEPLTQAVSLQPGSWRWKCMLGLALYESGRPEAGNAQFREASRLNPGWQEILNQEAWLFATHPDPNRRNANIALPLARQLCRATQDEDARFLDTLAAVYAEKGDFGRAVETASKASAIALATRQDDLARQIEGRLQLYRTKRPFRGTGTPATR